jgi:DNA-binding PadR family transcriptional regulator
LTSFACSGIISRKDISRNDSIGENDEEMVEEGREPRDLLPLTPAVLHILLALADGERHGYGIMREVEGRTGGEVRLGPGTLYGSIKRMLADGLIEESDERPDPEMDDQRRRYYRITDFGRRVAGSEAERLASLVETARERKILRRPRPGTLPEGT